MLGRIRKFFSSSSSSSSTTASTSTAVSAVSAVKYNELKPDDALKTDNQSQNRTPSMANAPNLVGFENGNWYKIRNVGDNTVVQLDEKGNKLICMPEETDGDQDLQRFQALRQPSGKFRIVSKKQKSSGDVHVWDYLTHRELLLLKKESKTEKFTQNWISECVPGFNSLYLIQSGPAPEHQKCLKNMGEAQQIKIVPKSEETIGDPFVHWNLELQDLPS